MYCVLILIVLKPTDSAFLASSVCLKNIFFNESSQLIKYEYIYYWYVQFLNNVMIDKN
jgi:hypothetical protein